MPLRDWLAIWLGGLIFTAPIFPQERDTPSHGLSGTDGKVVSLAYHQGVLYVGGEFSIAGNVLAKNVAQWDGKTWSPVGEGFDRPITKLVCDAKGNLYAAGHDWEFGRQGISHGYQVTQPGVIRKWDGKKWILVGTLNPNGDIPGAISDMVFDSQGRLFVSGSFYSVDQCATVNLAWWDAQGWHPGGGKGFPIGPKEYSGDGIASLVVGKNDILFATNRNRVGAWKPASEWSMVGDTLGGELRSLFLDAEGRMGVGGRFRSGNVRETPLALLHEKTWVYPMDSASSSSGTGIAYSTAACNDGVVYLATPTSVYSYQNGQLFATGGPKYENEIQGSVRTLLCDPKGNLYAAGQEIRLGSSDPPMTVVRWDGHRWQGLFPARDLSKASSLARPPKKEFPQNLALPGGLQRSKIKAFAIAPDGQVYISGDFNITVGKSILNRLARWDGKSWHAVGPGLFGPATVMAADRFGNLYAVAPYPSEWGNTSRRNMNLNPRLLRWDGVSWEPSRFPFGGARSLACDSSGYLYVGTTVQKAYWHHTLFRWDGSDAMFVDSTLVGEEPYYGNESSSIYQLDIIDNQLHVQGGFNQSHGKVCLGYAVYPLAAPDSARIRKMLAHMQRHADSASETTPRVRWMFASSELGEEEALRRDRLEISNATATLLDSLLLDTPDSSGIQAEAVVSAHPQGFQYAFPLGGMRPLEKKTIEIKKRQKKVRAAEPDAWLYQDSLSPILSNAELLSGADSVLTLFIFEGDDFTLMRGASDYEQNTWAVTGKLGTAFEIEFAKTLDSTPTLAAILEYIRGGGLFNAYNPPPIYLIAEVKSLSEVKKSLLARELFKWLFSFEKPMGENDLYNEVGEGDDVVPDTTDLKIRFADLAGFYLQVLVVVKNSLDAETKALIADKAANWRFAEEILEPVSSELKETNFVHTEEGLCFYPMALIVESLKSLGPGSKRSLEVFYQVLDGGL